jgi:hypothetical protein
MLLSKITEEPLSVTVTSGPEPEPPPRTLAKEEKLSKKLSGERTK